METEQEDMDGTILVRGVRALSARLRAKNEEEEARLGYCLAELEKVAKRASEDRREFVRHFDDYINLMVGDRGNDCHPDLIISRAAALAEARLGYLTEYWPQTD